jgi:iron complex transport system substrate-binding protein
MLRLLSILLAVVSCLFVVRPSGGEPQPEQRLRTPLDASALKAELGLARGASGAEGTWPRVVTYQQEEYDFRTDTFTREERTFAVKTKPLRIIPHAVGVAEILWAICPRERIVAFNEFAADPEFCFIAELVKKRGPIFQSKQTELVIGSQPDLVFTVFYSGADFKEKLKQARIPYFDLGYFGTIDSIEKQTLLIGKIIGEERNAAALVKTMDEKIRQIKAKLPKCDPSLRVLYYDEGGYIPGKSSNFNSICDIIQVVNVGAVQGITSWSKIDYETLLKWDPDIIIVPEESGLKEQFLANEVLSHARAIKDGKVYYIPGVYLRVDSQYILLSANLLAGIVYENAF